MGFTKETLWALRREIVLNSLFIADYRNSRHIDPHVVCDFWLEAALQLRRLLGGRGGADGGGNPRL